MALLQYYPRVLLSRWWLVVTLALAAAAAGYALSVSQGTVYRSAAKLYLMPARPDQGNVYFSQTVVRQYGELVVSDRILNNAAGALDLPQGSLRGSVAASGNTDRLAIYLTADHSDPVRAQAIAREVGRAFVEDQDQRMRDVSPYYRVDVRMYDDPAPAVLVRPQPRATALGSAALGLMLGMVAALVLEHFDSAIRNVEDVYRHVGLPVLAAIPRPV